VTVPPLEAGLDALLEVEPRLRVSYLTPAAGFDVERCTVPDSSTHL